MNSVCDTTTTDWRWKQFCADAKKQGAQVARVGDRVTVRFDEGGTGWTCTWRGETTLLGDGGGANA